jgi:hypothetical protein
MGNTKGTTKSGGQKHVLDKFYTKPEIAALYIGKAGISNFTTIIEPSAGNGSFSTQIADCIALDLKPEGDGIVEQDWLQYAHPEKVEGERILVIGNPPFGQQNSLAVKFINHAATFADRVAFILPISFRKESVQNRIHENMHLTFEEIIPKDSFLLNGEKYDVKCVFQIWDRKDEKRVKREKANLNSNNLFQFVRKADSPDAVIYRVGGRAGFVSVDWDSKTEMNHYFIRLNKESDRQNLVSIVDEMNKISYPSRYNSVGPRSVSKVELNEEINKIFGP